jgi:hypothetical protein
MKPEEIAKIFAQPQQVADSPTAKLIRKVAQSPTAQLVRQATESPTSQLARKVAQSPTGEAAKQASSIANELQAIRRQLATPKGSQAALAATRAARGVTEAPETLKPWLRTAKGRGVSAPLPSEFRSPAVISPPVPQKIDTEGLIRRAKQIFAEDAEAKRDLDRKMVETMEKMHGALVEANQRETEALDRAKAAEEREVAAQARTERREAFMVKMTVSATVIAALSLVGTVVAIFVAG